MGRLLAARLQSRAESHPDDGIEVGLLDYRPQRARLLAESGLTIHEASAPTKTLSVASYLCCYGEKQEPEV